MEQSLRQVHWREFLALAALSVLGPAVDRERDESLGDIMLLAHQREAIVRLEFALRKFGGALLADDVGLGKTFVALGLAGKQGGRTLVAAPASLREMWTLSA